MGQRETRRTFLRSATTAGLALGVGDLGRFAIARRGTGSVRFHASIEPLVRLLEETPREKVLEEFAARIRAGTTYAEVIAALHLAGIRNIPPRPDTGWKFHAVLVIHSAHLASRALPEADRWLPVFFALDFFKGQQAYDARESDWTMPAVEESAVPEAGAARAAFAEAMDAWDDAAADAATAGLVRGAEPGAVFEPFAHYALRDFRYIGHKAIYMANGWRTLQFLGRRHAEPMLRSLTYALLNHSDEPNPARSELEADAPWRHNLERVDATRTDGAPGAVDSKSALELLHTLRAGTWSDASGHVLELLEGGVSPRSIHDGLFLGAAELLLRQPGIVSLHGMTATNALAFVHRTTKVERTRRLLLLQNAAFLVQFREALREYGPLGDRRVDELQPARSEARGRAALEEIFQQVSADPVAASRKTLAYLRAHEGRPTEFMAAVRRWNTLKCTNGHDYKFPSAILEDYDHISPEWRDLYLAASLHYLRGSEDPENPVVGRTRAALGA